VSVQARRPRVAAERFERLYADSEDPWGYCTSDYERGKYADTLASLGSARYRRALEVGCSIGVFTAALAKRCDSVVAVDFSPRALEIAGERLRRHDNVAVELASFPERMPAGPWDLVLCSEVLYYLDRRTLEQAITWLSRQLELGSTVLAVSWRGPGETEPLRGEEVHDVLQDRLRRWHTLEGRQVRYRLDRFDGR
jgi:predicted TPR repeat methyltransferase